MTLQNRVMATGEITAAPFRGAWMGNRGILHDENRQLGQARWRHQNWVCCALDFKGTRRQLMAPGKYTELFFFDEPSALAAGHRPCAECRNADYKAFKAALEVQFGALSAPQMDRILHRARVHSRSKAQIRQLLPTASLPDGAMILSGPKHADQAALVWSGKMHPWRITGYCPALALPSDTVTVLTPLPTLAALANGYRPRPHPSLQAA